MLFFAIVYCVVWIFYSLSVLISNFNCIQKWNCKHRKLVCMTVSRTERSGRVIYRITCVLWFVRFIRLPNMIRMIPVATIYMNRHKCTTLYRCQVYRQVSHFYSDIRYFFKKNVIFISSRVYLLISLTTIHKSWGMLTMSRNIVITIVKSNRFTS